MGLAASQARLLSLTSRIHDVEYQAQMIQSAKLQLALQNDEVYRKYTEALDEQALTYKSGDKMVAANYDNLFGKGSVKNGLNSSYALRDKHGTLIIPDEIYDAYKTLLGDDKGELDPYLFAMYMISGINENDLANAENNFVENNKDTVEKFIGDVCEARNNILQQIAEVCGTEVDYLNLDEKMSTNANIDSIKDSIKDRSDIDQDKLDELLKTFETVDKKYKHQLYNKFGEQILQGTEGNSNADFDRDEFNYYLKYAKLIEYECGIEYVSKASDGGETFNTDPELLNSMLLNGYLWIDIVDMDNKTGEINPKTTSASTDNNISFVNKSSVDSTSLKKAEAEYEQALKKINTQDKKYDMELNRLETERSALTTEYDSVKKVIEDNIKRSFAIFS